MTVTRLAAVVLLVGSSCIPTDIRATAPEVEASTPPATLGLMLFNDGRIIDVHGGREHVIARWPSRSAPYSSPVETPYGFIGLARRTPHRGELDLWLISKNDRRIVARGVTQGFAASERGTKVVYGGFTESKAARTLMKIESIPGGRVTATISIDGYAEATGFVGERVLLTIGDGTAQAALWDPASGALERLRGYGSGGATAPEFERALLYIGDGSCWDVGGLADLTRRVPGRTCGLRGPAFSPGGDLVAGIEGPEEFGPKSRLLVFDAGSARSRFQSSSISGAFQSAWEEPNSVLVTALPRRDHFELYRCKTGGRGGKCVTVWRGAAAGRYSTWVIPYWRH